MAHVSWSKEVLKNDPVVPAAVWGNSAFRLDVNPPGCGADDNRQEFIDLGNVGPIVGWNGPVPSSVVALPVMPSLRIGARAIISRS